MARPVNIKEVKQRIKDNKTVMKDNKKIVTDALSNATKGNGINAGETRAALAAFIKATKRVESDNAKLTAPEDNPGE